LFSNSFTFSVLACRFTPTGEFVLRQAAAARPRRNEQDLPVERLCKFYPSGDMSESVPVYVTQYFHTVYRACLPCSLVSIVSKNRSGVSKPRGLNEFRSLATILARRRWGRCLHLWPNFYVASCLGFGYLVLYLRLFKAPLLFSTSGFLSPLLSGFLLPSLCLKGLVCVKLFAKFGCCRTLCPFP
jgi:hypothetical protein